MYMYMYVHLSFEFEPHIAYAVHVYTGMTRVVRIKFTYFV